jgi:homopolymeric O-antigen transport system permease protein
VEAARVEPFEVTLRADRKWLDLELRSVWRYRDLVWLLVRRDFVSKYKQTILGPLWFVIQPLTMTLVFTVIFGHVAGLSTDGLPPLLFYMCGQLGWNYFAQTFAATSTSLLSNAALFSKVYFPRLVVPVAALISNLFAFLIQAVTFVAFFCYFKFTSHAASYTLTWHAILLPLLVLQTAVLSLGIGLVMSVLTAKYRDLSHAMALFVQVWMYATPVIYPLSEVPASWRWVAAINPMTPIVESYRLLLLGAGTVEPLQLACSIGATIALALAGLVSFGRIEKTFVDIA